MSTSQSPLAFRSAYLSSLEHAMRPDAETCVICQEPCSHDDGGERAVAAHDNHVFGDACLRQWLEEKDTCPLCRCVLFRPDPVLAGPVIARPTSLDAQSLDNLQASVGYSYELARESRQQDHTAGNLAEIIERLQLRVDRYLRGDSDAGIDFIPYRGIHQPPPAIPGEPESEVSAGPATIIFWARWWSTFCYTNEANHRGDIHHPIASAIFFETIRSLGEWEGWSLTYHSLYHCLRTKVRSYFVRHLGFEVVPDNWAEYIDDMAVIASFLGTTSDDLEALASENGFDPVAHASLMEV